MLYWKIVLKKEKTKPGKRVEYDRWGVGFYFINILNGQII